MLPEEKAKAFFHLIRQLKLTPSPQGEGSFHAVVFGQSRCLSSNALSVTATLCHLSRYGSVTLTF